MRLFAYARMASLSALVVSLMMLAIPASLMIILCRTCVSRYVSYEGAVGIHILAGLDLFMLIASVGSALLLLSRTPGRRQNAPSASVWLVIHLARAQLVYWGWRVMANLGEILEATVYPFAVLGIFVSGAIAAICTLLAAAKYLMNFSALAATDVLFRFSLQAGVMFLILLTIHYGIYRLKGRAGAKSGESEVLTWLEKRQDALLKEAERASRAAL